MVKKEVIDNCRNTKDKKMKRKYHRIDKNETILNKKTGKKKIVEHYEYYDKRLGKKKVKKITRIYTPSQKLRFRKANILEDGYIEELNSIRKAIAKNIQFCDDNIQKHVYGNDAKKNHEMLIVEELIFSMQQVSAYNMVINVFEYLKDNRELYSLLKHKKPKLIEQVNKLAKEKFGIIIDDVIQ